MYQTSRGIFISNGKNTLMAIIEFSIHQEDVLIFVFFRLNAIVIHNNIHIWFNNKFERTQNVKIIKKLF